jgi:predicted Zn finger-like uncharacterized protein
MPTIVSCPSCAGKLRVPDDLRAQLVRCPACNHTFQADSAPAPPPPPLPLETPAESSPAWRDLPLEIPDSPAPAAEGPPGLVGAVELRLSLDDEGQGSPASPPPPAASGPKEPSPPAPPPARPVPPRRSPPRLNEEDDDLRRCPGCGKHIHRDSTRCYHCGERFGGRTDLADRVRREAPRRDREPDRGSLVLTLGIVSIVLVVVCGPVGLVLGIMAWVMGQGDLRKIRDKQMDAEGQGTTQAGWICGIIGTVLNGLALLACLGYLALIGFIIDSANSRPPSYRDAPPAPVRPVQPPVQKDRRRNGR